MSAASIKDAQMTCTLVRGLIGLPESQWLHDFIFRILLMKMRFQRRLFGYTLVSHFLLQKYLNVEMAIETSFWLPSILLKNSGICIGSLIKRKRTQKVLGNPSEKIKYATGAHQINSTSIVMSTNFHLT